MELSNGVEVDNAPALVPLKAPPHLRVPCVALMPALSLSRSSYRSGGGHAQGPPYPAASRGPGNWPRHWRGCDSQHQLSLEQRQRSAFRVPSDATVEG